MKIRPRAKLACHTLSDLRQYQQSEAASAQDTIRRLEKELAEKAGQASGSGKRKSDEELPPAKRAKASKNGTPLPLGDSKVTSLLEKATDPTLQVPQRVLEESSPGGASSATINAWTSKLKLSKTVRAELTKSLKTVNQSLKDLNNAVVSTLPDTAAKFGLPVAFASRAKNPDLLKIILAAWALCE